MEKHKCEKTFLQQYNYRECIIFKDSDQSWKVSTEYGNVLDIFKTKRECKEYVDGIKEKEKIA